MSGYGLWRSIALGMCLMLAPAHSSAEPKRRAKTTAKAPSTTRARKPVKAPKARKGERREAPKPRSERELTNEPSPPATADQRAAQAARDAANSEIVKDGETSVKVMTFSGIDIEGRLKSPQLLYFVNRIHTEFDRPKLPHRSFMPELRRSTEQEPLR